MPPPTKKPVAARSSSLRNEGEAIDTSVLAGPDGQSTLQLQLTDLSAPERIFTADHVDVVDAIDGGKRIVFWISTLYGEGARALLEMVMSKEAIASFSRTLDVLRDRLNLAGELTPLNSEPQNAVAMSANFVRMSTNELGAVLDFYYASPFSITASSKTSKIYVQGLARVKTSNLVFFAVVKHFIQQPENAS